MKIALIQMNPTVGALRANAARIVRHARDAATEGAEVIVFPELALCGVPPGDLLLQPDFMDSVAAEVERLCRELPPTSLVVVGGPLREGKKLFNAAWLFLGGQLIGAARKRLLSKGMAFNEATYFTKGTAPLICIFQKVSFAVRIGADLQLGVSDGEPVDAVLHLSAVPYFRDEACEEDADAFEVPVASVRLVGGQDEWVFAGGSIAWNVGGEIAARGALFCDGCLWVELEKESGKWSFVPCVCVPPLDAMAAVFEALKMALLNYTDKNHFPGVLVALSGGIDSALVAAIAVSALGRERVVGVTLPSAVTSPETLADALELAKRLGIQCLQIPIAPAVDLLSGVLNPACASLHGAKPLPGTLMEENLQARIRGNLVMALSNRFGFLVLPTGNKSEMSTGYSTLYGDMCGGFALLKDVPKTLVFELARWLNQRDEVIPPTTISRPPTAELRVGQLDSDSLPPYEVLDPLLARLAAPNASVKALVAEGFDEATVRRVIRLMNRSEFKRRQSAPGPLLTEPRTEHGAYLPMTNGFEG